jgi:hypothetical protein
MKWFLVDLDLCGRGAKDGIAKKTAATFATSDILEAMQAPRS